MKTKYLLFGCFLAVLIGVYMSPVFSINPSEIPPGCEVADEFDFNEGELIEPWYQIMTNCGPAVIGHQLAFDWETQDYQCVYTGSPFNICFLFQLTNPIGN